MLRDCGISFSEYLYSFVFIYGSIVYIVYKRQNFLKVVVYVIIIDQ